MSPSTLQVQVAERSTVIRAMPPPACNRQYWVPLKVMFVLPLNRLVWPSPHMIRASSVPDRFTRTL